MPARADFDMEALKPWLGHLMLLDVLGDGQFRYRVYGSRVAQYYGRDLQGRGLDNLPSLVREDVRDDYLHVVETRKPSFVEREHLIDGHRQPFGKLTLPLSEDSVTVTRLLAAIYPSQRSARG